MDFDNFGFWEREDKITKEKEIIRGCGITRRIVDLKENDELELKFFGEEDFSNDTMQIAYKFEIRNLEYFPENRTIRLVAQQEVYDFSLEQFVETEITYLFNYAGPIFLFSN